MNKQIATLVVIALVLLAGACGGDSAGNGTGIPEQDPQLVAAGDALYQANCSECHGSDLRGTDQGPSHLSIVYEPNHHGDGAFYLAVLQGVRSHHWRFGDMEPVADLIQDEVTAIIAFVRETQRIEGFEPYPP